MAQRVEGKDSEQEKINRRGRGFKGPRVRVKSLDLPQRTQRKTCSPAEMQGRGENQVDRRKAASNELMNQRMLSFVSFSHCDAPSIAGAGGKRAVDCLSEASFHGSRPLREAQETSVARAISFGSFSFSQKKMNRNIEGRNRFYRRDAWTKRQAEGMGRGQSALSMAHREPQNLLIANCENKGKTLEQVCDAG